MRGSVFPPEALIIGAQKSGTTTLAYLLNQHPMIELADRKETDFFTDNWERGIDWYRSCFLQQKAILMDASVGYTMADVGPNAPPDADIVPKRISEISPH